MVTKEKAVFTLHFTYITYQAVPSTLMHELVIIGYNVSKNSGGNKI